MTQIIGVDPGPDTGILSLFPHDGVVTMRALQVDAGSVTEALEWLHELANAHKTTKTVIAHERYVIGPGTHKLAAQSASQITRDLNGRIAGMARATPTGQLQIVVVETRAVDVKRWASEQRLRAAGVWTLTKGMRHARSAGWHACHTAVFRCGWPDPLGLDSGAPWRPCAPDATTLAPDSTYRVTAEYGTKFNTTAQAWR